MSKYPRLEARHWSRLALMLVASWCAAAEGNEDRRWVQGSWVNVRDAATVDAKVTGHLPANTEVRVLKQEGDACEVAWGEGERGFVSCKFVGDKPLALRDIYPLVFPDGTANPLYSPARTFWVAPSMKTLFDAGRYFGERMLSEKQRNLESGLLEDGQCCLDSEQKPPKLVRYPIPEFEAMKALLANGVVASVELDPPLLTCRQMQEGIAKMASPRSRDYWWPRAYPNWQDYPHAYPVVDDCRNEALPDLVLPEAKPSYFRDAIDILPGSADVERISAHFGIVERGQVTGSPKWVRDYENWKYSGAWDIGKYRLTLEKPVVENVIGRTGLVEASSWRPQVDYEPNGAYEGCAEGLSNTRRGKEVLAGYPSIKDPLIWFESTKPLPMKKVKIKSRRIDLSKVNANEQYAHGVVVHEVDIDSDGVADLVQWDSGGVGIVSGDYLQVMRRATYININGEWYPFDWDTYGECT